MHAGRAKRAGVRSMLGLLSGFVDDGEFKNHKDSLHMPPEGWGTFAACVGRNSLGFPLAGPPAQGPPAHAGVTCFGSRPTP